MTDDNLNNGECSEAEVTEQLMTSLKTGLTFGLTSGVITTLGLVVGLHAGTQSRVAVIGGILTVSISDSCSDALGMHVSEESKVDRSSTQIWAATLATCAAKFFFAITFMIPVILLPLTRAVWVSVVWGVLALTFLSWKIARNQHSSPWKTVGEHLAIAAAVIIVTHYVGMLTAQWLN